MSHFGIAPVLALSLCPKRCPIAPLDASSKASCPHRSLGPISSGDTGRDAGVGGKRVALVSAVIKQVWGAGSRRSGCWQEEASVTPAVTWVPPGKVHALPSPSASLYNAPIMCPGVPSHRSPASFHGTPAARCTSKRHQCCARRRSSAFPCPNSSCHPRALPQIPAALPVVLNRHSVPPNFSLMA